MTQGVMIQLEQQDATTSVGVCTTWLICRKEGPL
jgi:hypothetical protein